MPLYEYQCEACGERCEVIQKFSDPGPETCTQCGKGPMQRLQSSPAIQFKGSGWYITDYAQKGKTDGASTDAAKSGEKKSEPGTTETPAKADSGASTSTTTTPAKTKD